MSGTPTAVSYGTQPFSIRDAGAYPYSSGTAGDLVDIAGIKSVEQSMSVDTTENRGDDKVLASVASLDSIDLTITTAQYQPLSIAAIAGGTVSVDGTGDSAVTTLERKTTDTVPYFKLVGQADAKDAEGGAARVTYPKVSWQGGPDFSLADQAFAEISVSAKAIPDDSDVLYQYEAYAKWADLDS